MSFRSRLSVLMLLLILSASMSTLAALILIASSSIAKDVYAGFINRNVTDKKLTMLMRICAAFFILLSVITGLFQTIHNSGDSRHLLGGDRFGFSRAVCLGIIQQENEYCRRSRFIGIGSWDMFSAICHRNTIATGGYDRNDCFSGG